MLLINFLTELRAETHTWSIWLFLTFPIGLLSSFIIKKIIIKGQPKRNQEMTRRISSGNGLKASDYTGSCDGVLGNDLFSADLPTLCSAVSKHRWYSSSFTFSKPSFSVDASITNTQNLSRFSFKNCSTLSGSRFSKVGSSDRPRLETLLSKISLTSFMVSGDALQPRIAKSKD